MLFAPLLAANLNFRIPAAVEGVENTSTRAADLDVIPIAVEGVENVALSIYGTNLSEHLR